MKITIISPFDKYINGDNHLIDSIGFILKSGYNKFEGFVTIFEEKLTNYSFECQVEMLYWLGNQGDSEFGFNQFKELLQSDKTNFHEHDRLIEAFYKYLKNSKTNLNDKVINLAFEIYASKTSIIIL